MAEGDPKTHFKALSYSSASKYAECGMKWLLSRVFGLDKTTWYVTPMGTAVHTITEHYDKMLAGAAYSKEHVTPEAFKVLYAARLNSLEHAGVEILTSGRELKKIGKTGGPNKKDREWCEHFGPKYVQEWINFRRYTNFEPMFMPEGRLGIEAELRSPIGGYPFLGYADRVFLDYSGEPVVIDIKTGNSPGSSMQLQTYAVSLRQEGVDVRRAGFWMASEGRVAEWVDTPAEDDKLVHHFVSNVGRAIEAGVFIPSPSPMCSGCTVRDYCIAARGKRAGDIPLDPPKITIGEVVVDENGELI